MKTLFQVSIVVSLLSSCSSDKEKKNESNDDSITGGACTYVTHTLPAKVIKITKTDSTHFDILFAIDDRIDVVEKDTLGYYEVNKMYISQSEMDTLHAQNGDEFCYELDEITHGTCTPKIIRISMKRYNYNL